MPNIRRRRFSVQNEIREQELLKLQNGTQVCQQDLDTEIVQSIITIKPKKSKTEMAASSSKHVSPLEIISECRSYAFLTNKKLSTTDKDVTACSSNIDFYSILINDNVSPELPKNTDINRTTNLQTSRRRDTVLTRKDKTPRREKHPHRIKVRSPKRKVSTTDRVIRKSVGVNPLHQEKLTVETQEILSETEQINLLGPTLSEDIVATEESAPIQIVKQEMPTTPSLEDMCRICHGGEALSSECGQMISACSCRGTVGRVHVKCLERWLTESGKSRCELCGIRYATRRVHRYGVFKAFVMWALSQNAKQLLVDSLGIMLMSPLAVLAAWLSGRTLAGLMTQETHITPWPLASTFVLACMTLVCYYCWIVSAATRHALAWWIWYRSQYEVLLQLQEE